jgi:predicted TIM-barrel fold metal-dependent hydrolase
MNRRSFLGTALAATLASSPAAEVDDQIFPIVDTHQHLWDLQRFHLPWLEKVPKLKGSYLPKDYADATKDLGSISTTAGKGPEKIVVVKAIYMEVDVDPSQQRAEAEFVIDLCKKGEGPTIAAVISGRPASNGFKKYITRFKDSQYVKGVRQVLHNANVPTGYCLDPQFIKGVQFLGELGMSFDLCIRPTELLDAAKLIDSCPGTRFILDHCGNGDAQANDLTQWRRGMAVVARRKNVVCKVSGIVASAKAGQWTADDLAPLVNHTLDVFGLDRVMFGGDWPVCTLTATYKQWFEALKTIVRNRSEPDQQKLFHDNAVRFYGLA